ncbi:peptidoglycan DD-metalloendopeptidase family protein [Novosphingobium sp.]|uniref:M23 family metallopeptidase n=1 Tax=Novosphingobium sp. TaxID=1874826 RepID=UPI00286CDE98|nr:peptidoglycan DD-metalloendopeptidase family protein [Novosphingobium sp.]
MKNATVGRVSARLRSWFPDREFFMRSEGQVRFIKISARTQMIAAGAVAAFVLIWALTMAAMAISGYLSQRDRLSLLDREAKVTTAESRVNAYRGDLGRQVGDMNRRQDFIEKTVQAHMGDLPKDAQAGETVSDSASEAAATIKKVSLAVPEAAELAGIEARQLAFIEGLTRIADRRSAAAEAKLASLGISSAIALAALDDKDAQGGPLILMATAADGSIDPRFQRFGLSLARMDALERSVAGLPQVLPANLEYISSGFGFRANPFTGGGGEFHPGLDFKGPYGAPIYAAAPGTVSFVGVRSGYGNCVEIDHGNGLVTRYAHMSRFRAVQGSRVGAGDVIGLIGSTGRSTGPHLHFEVRINDRPVNPRPFLEAAPDVLQEARGAHAAQSAR